MAEEQVGVESQADSDVQAEAEKLGWIPPARYKGPADKYVDADEFIRRGEEILPIVRKQLKTREAEVSTLRGEVGELKEIVKANQEAMEALEKYHSDETKRKVAQVRKDLKAEIARASRDDDHEAVAEATDQLTQLNAKETQTEIEQGVGKGTPPKGQPLDPFFVEWAQDTGWYGKDRRRTALANAIGVELREKGDRSTGREFLDKIREEVEEQMPSREAPSSDKVGAARGGGTRAGNGKGFADLPAAAKEACDSYARDLVGKGRRYANIADWRKSYAKTYFEDQ